jgi:hypothetical protein
VSKEDKDDYEVGYGKPPKTSQFEKGVSGNPTDRPKRARDVESELLREANSPIIITENGKRIKMSKHRVIVKQLTINAMKSNPAALRMYFALYPKALEKDDFLSAQQNAKASDKATDLTDEELQAIIRASPEYKHLKDK